MRAVVRNNKPTSGLQGTGVYESVKAHVIADEVPSGKRILVEPLADKLFVSNTPVREALIRLAAERVIKDVPKSGFFIKEISESEVRDLYSLQGLLLAWSLGHLERGGRVPGFLKPPDLLSSAGESSEFSSKLTVRLTNELFIHIARQTGNADVVHLVRNINDRTYFVRRKDYEIFGEGEAELRRLCETYHQKNFARLRGDLEAYFRNRLDRLPELLRLLRGSLLRLRASSDFPGSERR